MAVQPWAAVFIWSPAGDVRTVEVLSRFGRGNREPDGKGIHNRELESEGSSSQRTGLTYPDAFVRTGSLVAEPRGASRGGWEAKQAKGALKAGRVKQS
jgi:hypothetical protein